MASLLTRLKQLIMRDVLPLREARAEDIFQQTKTVEWTPSLYADLIRCTQDWAEKSWTLLISEAEQEAENLLFPPWDLVRILKILDYLAGTDFLTGSLRQWNELQQIISQTSESDINVSDQILWHHQDLLPKKFLFEEMKLWMGLRIHALDFDAESSPGKINRWLYRSTDDLSPNPVKGLSGWCWAGLRFDFQGEWGRNCRILPSEEIIFSPKVGRKIVCPTIRILGVGQYIEYVGGHAYRLLIEGSQLELILWQVADSMDSPEIPSAIFPENHLEMPLSLQIPAFPFAQLHRLRLPLKALGLGEWFEPATKSLANVFEGKAAWLDELLIGSRMSMHPHPRPKRHLEPAQHTDVFDRPFGIMVRECRSGLPLLLGWIRSPKDNLTESQY